ncbi:MAG: hypothetical protein ABIU11_07815 [Chitinophagaceae bacterium]
MDINQPTVPPPYVPPPETPGMFATKIPSSIAFAVALLLFLMPFVDIKCNGTSLQTVTGVQLATGFKMNNNNSGDSFMNDIKTDKVDEGITKTTTKTDNKDPNMYALVALGLGVLGLLLSLTNAKSGLGSAMVTGIASAIAMIGMMIDVKKKVKLDMPDTGGNAGEISKGIDDFGKSMSDKINITVDFTPWFYIAVISFLAAAFFCYKRIQSAKSVNYN